MLSIGGVGGFGLAAPVIHAVHGRWGAAGISLGMRVLGIPTATVIGAAVGAAAWHDTAPGDTLGYSSLRGLVIGGLVGAGVGAISIATIDALVLARETKPTAASPTTSFHVTPSIDPARRLAGVGVVGTV